MNMSDLSIGDRVKTNKVIELYPTGVWPAGVTGRVIGLIDFGEPGDPLRVAHVKLDQHYPNLDEWRNCLIFWERADNEAGEASVEDIDPLVMA